MTLETSSVVFGTTTIDYTVRRTTRAKTVSVIVDDDDGVVLAAPQGASIERLDRIVRRKAKWITSNLRLVTERPPPMTPREFVSGETLVYAGRQHTLRVLVGADECAALEHGRLVVRIRRADARGGRRSSAVRRVLIAWFRSRADERIRSVVDAWATRIGMAPSRLAIVEQQRRWGSCSAAGEIRINWRVVGSSRRAIEYVVAHELTHLRYPDHTASFWRALGEKMPDYEARRAQLREIGPRLVW